MVYTESMSLFRTAKSDLAVALDVGSRTVKGLVYEISDTGAILKTHKRIAVGMPVAYSAHRIVGKLHHVLAGVIKEFGRIPAKTIAGFGTSLAEYHVEEWDVESAGERHEKTRIGRKEIIGYFNQLSEQHGREDRVMIATPAGVEVNGYAVPSGVFARDASGTKSGLEISGGVCRDIKFRALVSYFPSEIGTLLVEMKHMLGGVPIEFVPMAAVYQEALAHRLGVRDALLIDIGATTTMLVLLQESMLAHIVSFPFGVSHIASQEVGIKVEIREKDIEVWGRCFRDSLDFLYPFGPLTGETYLGGGGAHIGELHAYVEDGEWLKTLSYAATPRLTVLEGKSLLADSALQEFLQGPEDAGLASVVCYGMHQEVVV